MNWFICLSMIAGFIGFALMRSNMRKHNAVLTAFLAKHTYNGLSPADRARVDSQSINILETGGFGNEATQKFKDISQESSRYLLFSLAMQELGIQPVLPGYFWYTVKNPFTALIGTDMWQKTVHDFLQEKHKIDMDLT
jgi:hypothetical protein